MSDVAGRNVWLASMAALGARGGSSGEPPQTADHHGMAAIANLQPLPAAASASPPAIPAVDEPSKSPKPRGGGLSIGYVFMTYYICMKYMYMYTYTYTYIHTFIYIYTYSINIHT